MGEGMEGTGEILLSVAKRELSGMLLPARGNRLGTKAILYLHPKR